jgi:hypothetical protein
VLPVVALAEPGNFSHKINLEFEAEGLVECLLDFIPVGEVSKVVYLDVKVKGRFAFNKAGHDCRGTGQS